MPNSREVRHEQLPTGVGMETHDLASLHNKREQEHYRKSTWEYIQLLLETIDKEPQELGYKFCRWIGERLATYLASKTVFQ